MLILRSAIMLLTAVGMIVPAGAVSPCRCAEPDGCCQHRAPPLRPCCKQESKACRAKQRASLTEVTCADGIACSYCPCCSKPSSPAVPAAQPLNLSYDHDHFFAIVDMLASPPAAIDVQLGYLANEGGSPPGYPALRLHELKCVWLN